MEIASTRRAFLGLLASAAAWSAVSAYAQRADPGRRDGPNGGNGPRRRGVDDYALPKDLAAFTLLSLVLGRVSDGFKEHRPSWNTPIHTLLARHHVTAVFKAHDNFYARQECDGMLYLMVPQPSFAGDDRIRDLENYGYRQGTFLGNSGHVRVTVSSEQVVVDYIRSTPAAPVADHCVLGAR